MGSPRQMKKKKDHDPLGLCSNTSRKEWLKMIFIDTIARLRSFPKSFKPSILVHYYSNKSAWMNAKIFAHWMISENKKMAKKRRKILILLHKVGCHNVEGVKKVTKFAFDAYFLSNITLLFLPCNVTVVVQPLDQGILPSLKMRYKGNWWGGLWTNLQH